MNRHVFAMAALVATLAAGAAGENASAQNGQVLTKRYSPRVAQQTMPQASGQMRASAPAPMAPQATGRSMPPSNIQYGPNPEGFEGNDGGYYEGDSFTGHGGYGGCNCGPGGCDSDYGGCGCDGDYGGCECGDSGCNSGWGGSWCDCFGCCNVFGGPGASRRWFVTADYLYVSADISDAVSFLIHDTENFIDTFHQLDFQYESSYRFGGGYELGCCDEQLRFLFTRLSSFADDFTDSPDAVGPFETSPGPGGTLNVHADVVAKSYDLEYAKTIPLGGCPAPSGCGDCCNSCGPPCPAWDITWSGGVRFAQVNWNRTYASVNPQAELERTTRSTMDFDGGGPKVGLEGRRYFGRCNWCSAYLKGDVALLLGNVNIADIRDSTTIDNPTTTESQFANFRNIIPVTEIEAGGTAQLLSCASLSAGYLFSAWHDLGFRDEFNFSTLQVPTTLETTYDDANILGFDGFFARLEVAY